MARKSQRILEQDKILAKVRTTKRLYRSDEIPLLVSRAMKDAGGRIVWAKRMGITPQALSRVAWGQVWPSDKILADLGLEEIRTYRRNGPYQFRRKA